MKKDIFDITKGKTVRELNQEYTIFNKSTDKSLQSKSDALYNKYSGVSGQLATKIQKSKLAKGTKTATTFLAKQVPDTFKNKVKKKSERFVALFQSRQKYLLPKK